MKRQTRKKSMNKPLALILSIALMLTLVVNGIPFTYGSLDSITGFIELDAAIKNRTFDIGTPYDEVVAALPTALAYSTIFNIKAGEVKVDWNCTDYDEYTPGTYAFQSSIKAESLDFEVESTILMPTIEVTIESGSATDITTLAELRIALENAESGATIPLANAITIPDGDSLTLDKNVTLTVNGAHRHFVVNGTLTLQTGTTLTRAIGYNEKGGGIDVVGSGQFNMIGGAITNNQWDRGGAIYVEWGSDGVHITGGAITYNTATDLGGAVFASGSSIDDMKATLNKITIDNTSGTIVFSGNNSGLHDAKPHKLMLKPGTHNLNTIYDSTIINMDGKWTDGVQYGYNENDIFAKYPVNVIVEAFDNPTSPGTPGGGSNPTSVNNLNELRDALDEINRDNSVTEPITILLDGRIEDYTIKNFGDYTFEAPGKDVTLTVRADRRHFIVTGTNTNGGKLTIGAGITLSRASGYDGIGGGVDVVNYATFTSIGGTISNNKWDIGGAVFVTGSANAKFNMKSGTITDNTATDSGGGVATLVGSYFNMDGGVLSNNTAQSGGGVATFSNGTFNMNGGAVTGNTAQKGGGIFNGFESSWGKTNINGGEISGNIAQGNGGGILIGINTAAENKTNAQWVKVESNATFRDNRADGAYEINTNDPLFTTSYKNNISEDLDDAWTNGMTYGYNNFDIGFDVDYSGLTDIFELVRTSDPTVKPNAPQDFTVKQTGPRQVTVTWKAPLEGSPAKYTLMRRRVDSNTVWNVNGVYFQYGDTYSFVYVTPIVPAEGITFEHFAVAAEIPNSDDRAKEALLSNLSTGLEIVHVTLLENPFEIKDPGVKKVGDAPFSLELIGGADETVLQRYNPQSGAPEVPEVHSIVTTYESRNLDIATIDENGHVTILKEGEVTFVVTKIGNNDNGYETTVREKTLTIVAGAVGPTAPQNFEAEQTSEQRVNLTWDVPEIGEYGTITGYQVSLDGTTWVDKAATDRAHEFISLERRGTYTFYVRAVSAGGEGEAAQSSAMTLTSRPDWTKNVKVEQTGAWELTFTWNEPYDGGSPITGYSIYRFSDARMTYAPTNDTPRATVTELSDGSMSLVLKFDKLMERMGLSGVYYYLIVAENKHGYNRWYEDPNPELCPATMSPWPQPEFKIDPNSIPDELTVGDANFRLQTTGGIDSFSYSPAISGPMVTKNVTSTFMVVTGSNEVATVASNGTVTVKGPGTITVRATKDATAAITGYAIATDEITITVLPALPGAPGNVGAESDIDGNVKVTWDAPAGSVVDEYEVVITTATGIEERRIIVNGDKTEANTNLPDGNYTVKVTARNAKGDSEEDATASFDVKHMFKVTFDLNGGEGANETMFVDPDTAIGTLPAEPERSGFDFEGWYTTISGAGEKIEGTQIITAHTTFYARWDPPEFLYIDGDTVVERLLLPQGSAKTLAENDHSSILAEPLQNGRGEWKGWNTQKDGKGVKFDDVNAAIPEDLAVYAQFLPGAPSNVTAKADINGNITVTWGDAPGVVDEYEIIVTGQDGNPKYKVNGDGENKIIIDDLDEGTYSVTVRARNIHGDGADSTPVTDIVVENLPLPGTPGNVNAEADEKGSITITWDIPTDGGRVDGYVIIITDEYGNEKRRLPVEGGDKNEIIINGLEEGTYTVTVIAKNDKGQSPAAPVEVELLPVEPSGPAGGGSGNGNGYADYVVIPSDSTITVEAEASDDGEYEVIVTDNDGNEAIIKVETNEDGEIVATVEGFESEVIVRAETNENGEISVSIENLGDGEYIIGVRGSGGAPIAANITAGRVIGRIRGGADVSDIELGRNGKQSEAEDDDSIEIDNPDTPRHGPGATSSAADSQATSSGATMNVVLTSLFAMLVFIFFIILIAKRRKEEEEEEEEVEN